MREAKPRLDHVQTNLMNNFKRLGVVAKVLNGKDLLRNFPDFVLPVLQIFDILRIDGAGLVGSLCVLVQVVAAVTEKPFIWWITNPTCI